MPLERRTQRIGRRWRRVERREEHLMVDRLQERVLMRSIVAMAA